MIRGLLLTGQITVKSQSLFDELDEFEYSGDKVVHTGSERRDDAATGKSHGDIVTALGMVAVTFTETSRNEMRIQKKDKPQVLPNWNSLEGRYLMYEQLEREDELELTDW